MTDSKILPIWQPVAMSTHLISQRVGEHFNVKTSHTGTLDPMAEGVIIVLLGEERLKKKEHAKWKKGYEFEIALGIQTDTYDGMGIIKNVSYDREKPDSEKIKKILRTFIGNYNQKIPPFSTKKVKGKHLHQLARKNNIESTPAKRGNIYKLDLLDSRSIKMNEITKDIIDRILLVTGDFRQEEIIQQWVDFSEKNRHKDVIILKFYVETSKGLYIRSLSQDICKKMGTVGFAYKIIRTKNGNYTKQNSQTLKQIFGPNYKKEIDFVSKPNLR